MERLSYNCWWLGINNLCPKDGRSRVVLYPQIKPFIDENEGTFKWPPRGKHKSCYDKMKIDDRAILWMGHSATGEPLWGVMGFAIVENIDETLECPLVMIRRDWIPLVPLSPYDRNSPRGSKSRTTESDLLWDVFGEDFEPLFDVFSWLGYLQPPKQSIITAYSVNNDCYGALRKWMEREHA